MADQPLLQGGDNSSLEQVEGGDVGSVSIGELMARPPHKIQEYLAESGIHHVGFVTSNVRCCTPSALSRIVLVDTASSPRSLICEATADRWIDFDNPNLLCVLRLAVLMTSLTMIA